VKENEDEDITAAVNSYSEDILSSRRENIHGRSGLW